MSQARALAVTLPRSYEALVGGRIKIRVGRLVYLAFSPDEQVMGFAFPKYLREALIRSAPEKFAMPRPSDERYNWVRVRLPAVDEAEMRALVVDAWAMVVPKSLAAGYLGSSESRSRAE